MEKIPTDLERIDGEKMNQERIDYAKGKMIEKFRPDVAITERGNSKEVIVSKMSEGITKEQLNQVHEKLMKCNNLLKPTTTTPKRIRPKVKIYDKVLTVLQDHPETRNSDDILYWQVLFDLAFAVRKGDLFGNEYWLSKSEFMQAPRYESIRRSRQKAQQRFPELQETDTEVKKARDNKRKMGGNFIYGENARGRNI